MSIEMNPIGYVHAKAEKPPRHWSVSEEEGELVIDESYREGLREIQPGQEIVVLFHFDRSPPFSSEYLRRTADHFEGERGVFSICSPVRPNPIGLSVLRVLGVDGTRIRVRGVDMLDNTPILDIKPHVVKVPVEAEQ